MKQEIYSFSISFIQLKLSYQAMLTLFFQFLPELLSLAIRHLPYIHHMTTTLNPAQANPFSEPAITPSEVLTILWVDPQKQGAQKIFATIALLLSGCWCCTPLALLSWHTLGTPPLFVLPINNRYLLSLPSPHSHSPGHVLKNCDGKFGQKIPGSLPLEAEGRGTTATVKCFTCSTLKTGGTCSQRSNFPLIFFSGSSFSS